jgi:hypothetical protein
LAEVIGQSTRSVAVLVLHKEEAAGVLRAGADGDVAGENLDDETFEPRDAIPITVARFEALCDVAATVCCAVAERKGLVCTKAIGSVRAIGGPITLAT